MGMFGGNSSQVDGGVQAGTTEVVVEKPCQQTEKKEGIAASEQKGEYERRNPAARTARRMSPGPPPLSKLTKEIGNRQGQIDFALLNGGPQNEAEKKKLDDAKSFLRKHFAPDERGGRPLGEPPATRASAGT